MRCFLQPFPWQDALLPTWAACPPTSHTSPGHHLRGPELLPAWSHLPTSLLQFEMGPGRKEKVLGGGGGCQVAGARAGLAGRRLGEWRWVGDEVNMWRNRMGFGRWQRPGDREEPGGKGPTPREEGRAWGKQRPPGAPRRPRKGDPDGEKGPPSGRGMGPGRAILMERRGRPREEDAGREKESCTAEGAVGRGALPSPQPDGCRLPEHRRELGCHVLTPVCLHAWPGVWAGLGCEQAGLPSRSRRRTSIWGRRRHVSAPCSWWGGRSSSLDALELTCPELDSQDAMVAVLGSSPWWPPGTPGPESPGGSSRQHGFHRGDRASWLEFTPLQEEPPP
nr:uncharacterized protein LOC129007717 isoform X3 [Pongo pygmaeus]